MFWNHSHVCGSLQPGNGSVSWSWPLRLPEELLLRRCWSLTRDSGCWPSNAFLKRKGTRLLLCRSMFQNQTSQGQDMNSFRWDALMQLEAAPRDHPTIEMKLCRWKMLSLWHYQCFGRLWMFPGENDQPKCTVEMDMWLTDLWWHFSSADSHLQPWPGWLFDSFCRRYCFIWSSALIQLLFYPHFNVVSSWVLLQSGFALRAKIKAESRISSRQVH
jgi:hypothetical protein